MCALSLTFLAPVTLTLTLWPSYMNLTRIPWRHGRCAKMKSYVKAVESYHIKGSACMHLVTCSHFQSHDKDGADTTRSAIAKNPMLHASFVVYVCQNRSYYRWKYYFAGVGIFDLICSCDLDLDPMILHIQTWSVFSGDILYVQIWPFHVKAFESYLLMSRQTRPKLYTMPVHRWSVNCLVLRDILSRDSLYRLYHYLSYISVWFCLQAPGYGLTLRCVLGLLVAAAVQVPQLQLLMYMWLLFYVPTQREYHSCITSDRVGSTMPS